MGRAAERVAQVAFVVAGVVMFGLAAILAQDFDENRNTQGRSHCTIEPPDDDGNVEETCTTILPSPADQSPVTFAVIGAGFQLAAMAIRPRPSDSP